MEKIFPYRYKDESRRVIFNIVDECYLFEEVDIEDIFNDYLSENQLYDANWDKNTFNELDDNRKRLVLEYKEKNKEIYNQKKCQKGQYKPSNYYKDELAVYSICIANNNKPV